jgi:hypothetical protein
MIVWTDAILPADLDQGFLEAILDIKELDERRHPRNVWKTKGKPEWERRKHRPGHAP